MKKFRGFKDAKVGLYEASFAFNADKVIADYQLINLELKLSPEQKLRLVKALAEAKVPAKRAIEEYRLLEGKVFYSEHQDELVRNVEAAIRSN